MALDRGDLAFDFRLSGAHSVALVSLLLKSFWGMRWGGGAGDLHTRQLQRGPTLVLHPSGCPNGISVALPNYPAAVFHRQTQRGLVGSQLREGKAPAVPGDWEALG